MTSVTTDEVKSFLLSFLSTKLRSEGKELPPGLSDGSDLFMEGLIDSLGVLELTAEVEKHFNREIDFEDLDPEEMTVVGPFCNYVASRLNES
jgi:acyl carrier protein